MTRVRRGFKARRRRNKVLKQAKGFHFDRRTKFRRALETVHRALYYSYIGRKQLKRDMRALWITRINAGARLVGTSYSRMINLYLTKNINLNRKMLAELAATDMKAFEAIYNAAK